jgi:hypothetical protein
MPEKEQPEHDLPRPQPQIASPTLKRKPGVQDQVEPHLHLMCDILPCPHQAEHKKWIDECKERSDRERGSEASKNVDQKKEKSDGIGEYDREQQLEERREKKDKFSEESEDSELLGEKHGLGKLPEQSEISGESDVKIGTKGERKSRVRKQMRDICEKDSLKSCNVSDSFENDIPVRDSGLSDIVGDQKVEKKNRDTETLTNKDTEKKSLLKLQKQKRGTRNIPLPKVASDSPKKRNSSVDNVVGAVVAERLFVSPTSSVESFMSERNKPAEISSERGDYFVCTILIRPFFGVIFVTVTRALQQSM